MSQVDTWSLALEYKPDFDQAMERISAWFAGAIVDRPPVQFSSVITPWVDYGDQMFSPEQWKQRWFDAERVVESFESGLSGSSFLAETFPIFWPNLGPSVYSAFYGCELVYEPTTSWAVACVKSMQDVGRLQLDWNNEYLRTIDEITQCALQRCEGKYMVGYTDLHPGMDCVAAWRGTEELLMDIYDNPELIEALIDVSVRDFQKVYDHWDTMLKAHRQLSATWMGIPSYGKMHIPSCDFSAMISPEQFEEYCLPILQKEVQGMTQNIWHLDGPDCARHLEMILSVPEVAAIQWVQGAGPGEPIMQWIELLQRIRRAGRPVVVYLRAEEVDDFMEAMSPEGLLLCIGATEREQQEELLARIERWA